MTIELTRTQIDGIQWIINQFKHRKGLILADYMGLGKTAQAIEVIKRGLRKAPALIICPAYLVFNWLDELKLWGVDLDRVCVIDTKDQLIHDADIYLVSYHRVTQKLIFEQLFTMFFSILVCDEAHYLKTWNSLRSRKILGTRQNKNTHLRARSNRVLLMTGTPVLNRVEELYNLVIRLAPEVLDCMSRESFIYKYAKVVRQTIYGLKHEGVKNVSELRQRLEPVLLGRRHIEGLPDRVDRKIKLRMDKRKLAQYIQRETDFLGTLGVDLDSVQHDLTMSRSQMDQLAEIRQNIALFKLPLFVPILNDLLEKHESMVIYTHHRKVHSQVLGLVRKKSGVSVESITGSVSYGERAAIIKKFQSGTTKIIVATLGALREGVNLTRGQAVVFLELDWTPANMEQAISRLHRKGQTNTVIAYYLYFDGGIDGYIMRMLARKENMIQQIMGAA